MPAGRPAHPLARSAARAGSAADGLQVVRRARLCAREPAQPQRHRRPERPLRHHRQRQGLQRHAPGAARPRARRRRLPAPRHPPAQGQRGVAARGDDHARVRARACRRSSSSRRSARSSSTSSRKSSTTGAPTCARTCSASSTSPRATSSGGEWSQPNPSENWLLRAQADLTPALIAQAIAKRLKKLGGVPALDRDTAARIDARIALIEAKERSLDVRNATSRAGERIPYFCSGCPHNTSTAVPEGSRAVAGIGCHYMAVWMDRCDRHLQPDGRRRRRAGSAQAPFTSEPHIFAEPRRRHLLPLGPARDPPGDRGRRQHHLQDPLQRRGRDDRRPADRRHAEACPR